MGQREANERRQTTYPAKHKQVTADCTDPSCPTITASQLTGGLYGPGAAESAGTFVAKGISFGGDDYDDNNPRDFTVTAACGAKKQ